MNLKEALGHPLPDVGDAQLENIFELQKIMMQPYIAVEGLPQYPIVIDKKENQVIMKDFISRIIEELGEAFEMYKDNNDIYSNNKISEKDFPLMLSNIEKLNEECSDALHFFIETLIYSNISALDIRAYYLNLLESTQVIHSDRYNNTLELIMKYAVLLNRDANKLGYKFTIGKTDFTKGGRLYGNYTMEEIKGQLWDITYALQLARNCLKNKAWKQTEEVTNEQLFQNRLMEAWVYFTKFLNYLGMDHASVFDIYFRKNLINIHRTKTNY